MPQKKIWMKWLCSWRCLKAWTTDGKRRAVDEQQQVCCNKIYGYKTRFGCALTAFWGRNMLIPASIIFYHFLPLFLRRASLYQAFAAADCIA